LCGEFSVFLFVSSSSGISKKSQRNDFVSVLPSFCQCCVVLKIGGNEELETTISNGVYLKQKQ